jgi:hypothetical protein
LVDFPTNEIEALFGVQATIAPYTPDGSAVYELNFHAGDEHVHIVLWPSLARVDVRCGQHSWVMKAVDQVEFVPDVEVIFKPAGGEAYLFVAKNGLVSMVA